MKKLLLLSSSRVADSDYLQPSLPLIRAFLPESAKKIGFVPFAGVTINDTKYTEMVSAAVSPLALEVVNLAASDDPVDALSRCDAVMVGGGNTFQLLKQLYDSGLLDAIRTKVSEGMPYIGWSAGSNVAGLSIRTTNDMPIVEPPSFAALALVPFQINPHFTDYLPPGHNGETRRQRLEEFLALNHDATVYGLPEGTGLQVLGNEVHIVGEFSALKLEEAREAEELQVGSSFSI